MLNYMDEAFACFAQATEGDFTVGQAKLNQIAEIVAYNWVYLRVFPDETAISYTCQRQGVKFHKLLLEEADYLNRKIKEEIKRYGG